MIAIRVLDTRAHLARDDEPAADSALAEALRHAASERSLRVFVDEGAALAEPLARLLAERPARRAQIPRAFLHVWSRRSRTPASRCC